MFGIGSRKPRQFEYRPRYYDAEKEARNQRRIELGHEPIEDETPRERKPGDIIRERGARRRAINERERIDDRKRNGYRMLIVVVLVLGLMLLLYHINF